MDDQTRNTQESYDRVAAEYSQRIGDELDHKPLERQLLDRFAAGVTGRVCDLGCGPGHIAAYLREQGILTDSKSDELEARVLAEVDAAQKIAEDAPPPQPEDALGAVYAEAHS